MAIFIIYTTAVVSDIICDILGNVTLEQLYYLLLFFLLRQTICYKSCNLGFNCWYLYALFRCKLNKRVNGTLEGIIHFLNNTWSSGWKRAFEVYGYSCLLLIIILIIKINFYYWLLINVNFSFQLVLKSSIYKLNNVGDILQLHLTLRIVSLLS